MVIQHNLASMNANRMLGVANSTISKSSEKLSSGYRINRAADDAAGLSISEKMRKQIRGLDKSADNIQDGISLAQVADGALGESQDILQRMNELAVQSANGTLSETDRDAIQAEINQLKLELNRIATSTSFNDEIYPLNSSAIELPDELTTATINLTNDTGKVVTVNGTSYQPGDNITVDNAIYTKYYNLAFSKTFENRADAMSYYYSSDGSQYTSHGLIFYTGVTSLKNYIQGAFSGSYDPLPYTDNISLLISTTDDILSDADGDLYFYSYSTAAYWIDYFTSYGYVDQNLDSSILHHNELSSTEKEMLSTKYGFTFLKSKSDGSTLLIQSSGESTDQIEMKLCKATANALGLSGISVATQSDSLNAIDSVASALTKVSKYRSRFGAYQNRLEHAYNNNKNAEENTTAAESRIRDTDMAKEMTTFSADSIIQQAGQAMLSQANTSLESVLQLLQ